MVRVLVRCGIILLTHVTAIKQRTSESDFESTDEFQELNGCVRATEPDWNVRLSQSRWLSQGPRTAGSSHNPPDKYILVLKEEGIMPLICPPYACISIPSAAIILGVYVSVLGLFRIPS